jgi:hypothetical protein
MERSSFYPFYPERILWKGVLVLGFGFAIAIAFLVFGPASSQDVLLTMPKMKKLETKKGELSFSFSLKEVPIHFPLTRLQPEIVFSLDLPRPDRNFRNADLFVLLKHSGESKTVSLPCRIDLERKGDQLGFTDKKSPFWLELENLSEREVEATVWVELDSKEKVEAERFLISSLPKPIQGPEEFSEGSPFRFLSEAKWLGHDVFREKYNGVQTLRISVGAESNPVIELRDKEWLVWREGRWEKGMLGDLYAVNQKTSSFADSAIARIESVDSKSLILEAWSGENHARIALLPQALTPFKIRLEEIFNAIRVRSEKQISCMMEKQCLILRVGDWVLKQSKRWKVLRKKEEKEAYESGKLEGELFVFEAIESKQGQKFISGILISFDKSQLLPIDLPANKNPPRKEAKDK